MRILLSFLQDTTIAPHAVPAYRFWGYYIKNGIEEAGMQWLEVPGADWAEGLLYTANSKEINSWLDKTWQATLTYIKANMSTIDVFLCYLHPKQVDVNAIIEIKKLGIPCINFYCDNVREFEKAPNSFKVFNLIWVPEYEAILLYKQANIKYANLPMPMWVDKKYRQNALLTETSIVSFIGSKDVYREQLLGEAISKGLKIHIRGNGWRNNTETKIAPNSIYKKIANQIAFINNNSVKALIIKGLQKNQKIILAPIDEKLIHHMPDFEEYIQLTKGSTITLGINRVPTFKRLHSNPLTYSRLRDIEAPMLGACYLTEYCEGLNHMYNLDNDIQTYKNTDELIYKATELLNNKHKRLELRKNGQHAALTTLSIPVTLNKLKSILYT